VVFGPPRYEVRHLEALRAVADEGTFRAAADVLGYSQAAISQQIAGLEALVGSPVFDRPGGPKPVVLTADERFSPMPRQSSTGSTRRARRSPTSRRARVGA